MKKDYQQYNHRVKSKKTGKDLKVKCIEVLKDDPIDGNCITFSEVGNKKNLFFLRTPEQIANAGNVKVGDKGFLYVKSGVMHSLYYYYPKKSKGHIRGTVETVVEFFVEAENV